MPCQLGAAAAAQSPQAEWKAATALPRWGKNPPPYLKLLYLKGNQLLQQPGPGWACLPLARCGHRADTWMEEDEGKAREAEARMRS